MVDDRLVKQTEAAKILAMSVATLRRRADIPRVELPTGGRKRKVRYLYRYSTLVGLMAKWEKAS